MQFFLTTFIFCESDFRLKDTTSTCGYLVQGAPLLVEFGWCHWHGVAAKSACHLEWSAWRNIGVEYRCCCCCSSGKHGPTYCQLCQVLTWLKLVVRVMNPIYCSLGHRSKFKTQAEDSSSLIVMFLYVFMTHVVSSNAVRVRCVATCFTTSSPSLGYGFQLCKPVCLRAQSRVKCMRLCCRWMDMQASMAYGMEWSATVYGLGVFRNDGCNNMSLSQAFRYDATTPTVLEVYRHWPCTSTC